MLADVPEIPALERFDLLAYLGLVRVMEPHTEMLMRERAEADRLGDDYDSPHSRPWFVSFHGCLAGETAVVTRTGIKPIRELIGTHELLIPAATKHNGLDREGRGQRLRKYNSGGFQKVQVSSYGIQQLYEVKLRRGRQRKTVRATAAHRWMLKTTEMVDTLKLRSGDKLKGIRARRVGSIKMVPFAVAQGFVFGDGTARRGCRDAAWLDLHHNCKDEAMLAFFQGHQTRPLERKGRMSATQIQGLPRLWKQVPSFEESTPFLLSWLAGYFAADGSVSKKGQATLVSISREAIDFARGVMSICGVSYGAVTVDVQRGTYPQGQAYEDKTMYSISMNVRDLPAWFFVLPKHAERVQERLAKEVGERQEWQVDSVSSLGISEEVFCATVPDVGCFALSDELLTGNSEFPGEPADACKRYLAYRMMNIPRTEAMPPWVTTTGTVGKAGELDIAEAWFRGGRLLAVPEDPSKPDQHQLGFVDPRVWMTVSTDLPILPPGWHRPHIVEVKCKADDVIEEMIQGRLVQRLDGTVEKLGRGPDPKHAIQLKATIGLAHEFDWGEVTVCSGCWRILFGDIFRTFNDDERPMNPAISPERAAEDNLRYCPWCNRECGWETFRLDQPTTGEIYYWSRSWPRKTKSFYYDYDPEFIERGRRVLAETREHYINDEIPPRPDHFQWALGACRDCTFKPMCKQDFGLRGKQRKPRPDQVRTRLTESFAVEYAQSARPGYDPHAVRDRVFKEWGYER